MLLTPKNNVGVDNTVNEMPKAFSTCWKCIKSS